MRVIFTAIVTLFTLIYGFDHVVNGAETNAILTAYCSCEKCCSWHVGKDGKPKFNIRPNVTKIVGQTASGTIAKASHTLAAPRGVQFGSKVYIDFHGHSVLLGTVEDRGGAIHAKDGIIRIDVYFDSHKKALEFGIRKVNITLKELPELDITKIIRKIK